jgi:hypothetical protein
MKFNFFLILFFFSFLAQSQIILDTIAKETCSCLKNKDLDFKNENDLSKIEMELGFCMITNINKHNSDLTGMTQIDYSNSDELTKLSGEIAVKMLNYCPDYLFSLGKISTKTKENPKDSIPINCISLPINLLECTLIEVKKNQFVSLIVKDTKNKLHTLLILNYF